MMDAGQIWLSCVRCAPGATALTVSAVLWVALSSLLCCAASGGVIAPMPTGKTFRNSIGMEFVRIEPGSFVMGHHGGKIPDQILDAREADGARRVGLPDDGDYDEVPAHKVTISNPFYIGICEVTNQQYEQFDPLHVYLRGKVGFSIDNDEAVIFVSWHEAQAFCDWLSRKEGLPYRLPTEAEWEYACRAGTTTLFSTGDTLPEACVKNPGSSWYPTQHRARGRAEVVPLHVGKTPPNPWGIYDMHGNVEEWCDDWYGPYEAQEQTDPVGRADGDFKVTRGGSHSTFPYYMRSANRMGSLADNKSWYIGFRVVLGEIPPTAALPPVPPARYQLDVRQDPVPRPPKGPDPDKPHFRGPVEYVKIPEGSRGPLYSHHNHDPAITECPNGDLLAVWYTTAIERGRELAVAISRLRRGEQQWEEASPFWDAPDRNDHCPVVWFDGKKTLYHFNSLSAAATWGPLAILMRTSIDNGVSWSRARMMIPEHHVRHQLISGVFRTREGYVVLPCDASPGGRGGTALLISRDEGQTWVDAGGTIAGIHAGVAQLSDGRLLAFGRGDEIDGRMPQSISCDMGKTWERTASPFPPIGGGRRLVLMRLRARASQSSKGPLLFVSFAGDPMMITDAAGKQRPVQGMFGALSYDDGKTWPKMRLVSDDGPGREAAAMDGIPFVLSRSSAEPRGYLAACQGANGLIHLISSRNHYCFNLKWLETPPPAVEPADQPQGQK